MSEPHFRQRPWGYDRAQVDAFVERTASRFASLQSTAVPENAVRETIDRISDETNAVLQQAYAVAREVTERAERDAEALADESRRQAQELTAHARREAEELTARSQQEAAEHRRAAEEAAAAIVRGAEAQANALDREIESLGQERDSLLAEIERISQRLHALVSGADDDRSVRERHAPADTVETARAVAARPAGLAATGRPRPPVTAPAAEQRTTEMPAAGPAREEGTRAAEQREPRPEPADRPTGRTPPDLP